MSVFLCVHESSNKLETNIQGEEHIVIEVLPRSSDNILGLKLSGIIHHQDYQRIFPIFERTREAHGKLRLLLNYDDFAGWDTHGLWDDMRFNTKYRHTVERIAIVGGDDEESWPRFTVPKKYFAPQEMDAAWDWLHSAFIIDPCEY
ncbi:STAS/SEC14 domain-containing protein [Ktedonobacteria bacterium brp13]|nr:STAS/SEC14 domain-containing protein [Ktedonobacteria bacterium brp13]